MSFKSLESIRFFFFFHDPQPGEEISQLTYRKRPTFWVLLLAS